MLTPRHRRPTRRPHLAAHRPNQPPTALLDSHRQHLHLEVLRRPIESALDAPVIRNRAKIQATVDNAQRDDVRVAEPRRAREVLRVTRKRAPRSSPTYPKSTPQAEAFAKQLKSQGYRFVGPTSVYAFMQNVGVVNDHLHGCFRATDYRTSAGSR